MLLPAITNYGGHYRRLRIQHLDGLNIVDGKDYLNALEISLEIFLKDEKEAEALFFNSENKWATIK